MSRLVLLYFEKSYLREINVGRVATKLQFAKGAIQVSLCISGGLFQEPLGTPTSKSTQVSYTIWRSIMNTVINSRIYWPSISLSSTSTDSTNQPMETSVVGWLIPWMQLSLIRRKSQRQWTTQLKPMLSKSHPYLWAPQNEVCPQSVWPSGPHS